MYDVDGGLIRKIKLLRINDLALTRDGTVMVMVTQEKLIKVQRLLFDGKDVRLTPHCFPALALQGVGVRNANFSLGVSVAILSARSHVKVIHRQPSVPQHNTCATLVTSLIILVFFWSSGCSTEVSVV